MALVSAAGDQDEALRKERQAICVWQLYVWSAFVGSCLIAFPFIESIFNRFQESPPPHHIILVAGGLAAFAAALLVRCSPAARRGAEGILAVGSIVATLSMLWVWERLLVQFKGAVLNQHPYLANPRQYGCLAPPPAPIGPEGGLLSVMLNVPPADFLDAAVLFIVLLEHAVQSVCVCRMRFRTTAVTTGGSCCVLILWPVVARPAQPLWFLRVAYSVTLTAIIWYFSYSFDVGLTQQVALRHKLLALQAAEVQPPPPPPPPGILQMHTPARTSQCWSR